MRTVGIIAEYNPFHTGHAYHLKKAKELSGADYAVVVMSPDFVQRGEPAIFDKYTRAEMALKNGADLVIELPVCYACGSAEYFARGAVALLDSLGVVDTLCFGGESDDIRLFYRTADTLLSEPEAYTKILREQLKEGKTYPQARCCALSAYFARESGASEDRYSDFQAFFSEPNNILGVEYCKALLKTGSSITPLPLKRLGNGYNSPALEGKYCSATAIRRAIRDCRRYSAFESGLRNHAVQNSASEPDAIRETARSSVLHGCDEMLLRYIPDNCHELFQKSCQNPCTFEEFMPCLTAKLLSGETFDHILDITPELSDRLCSLRFSCIGKSFEDIVSLLKTKQMTEARIRRALLHLLLTIRTEDVNDFLANGTVYYAKVLGFRRDASSLLHGVKENCSIPFITKNARGKTLPGPYAKRMWDQDVFASHLYRGIWATQCHGDFRTEYEISPVVTE